MAEDLSRDDVVGEEVFILGSSAIGSQGVRNREVRITGWWLLVRVYGRNLGHSNGLKF